MTARFTAAYGRVRSNYFVRNLVDIFQNTLSDRITKVAFAFFIAVVLMGAFGPQIAPYNPSETQYSDSGDILRTQPPSIDHPMGTDRLGRDIFSMVLVGAQPTMLLVVVVGTMILTIGSVVGVTAGYVGGLVDEVLMRFTDFIYSVPLLPAALVLVVILESGFWTTAFIIGALIWRGMARVLRSQVLQVKERPFVMAAKSTGASTPRILLKHIFPNVAPMAILFTAIGAGYAVIIQAGLAFLGLADPSSYTWGIILRNAYQSGVIVDAWWWALFPGLLISFTVLSLFLIGRGYEDDDVAEDMMASA
ncbi:ABC transporter permease [Salinibaculum sp. GCM10025337]|uniref:ABC transporter permease n=1 Tax=Salinibaculum sp. GCM10025337 TaxID=3252686 RepID=UPI00361F282E